MSIFFLAQSNFRFHFDADGLGGEIPGDLECLLCPVLFVPSHHTSTMMR